MNLNIFRYEGKRKGRILPANKPVGSFFSRGPGSNPFGSPAAGTAAPNGPRSSPGPTAGTRRSPFSSSPSTSPRSSPAPAAGNPRTTFPSFLSGISPSLAPSKTAAASSPARPATLSSARPSSSIFSTGAAAGKPRSTAATTASYNPAPRPRSAFFSSPASPPSQPASSSSLGSARPSSGVFPSFSLVSGGPSAARPNSVVHTVEIHSSDVEGGLGKLLAKVPEAGS